MRQLARNFDHRPFTAVAIAITALIVPLGYADAAASPLHLENAQVETRSGGPSLEAAIREVAAAGDDLWLEYAVPAMTGDYRMCCGSHWKRREYHGTCHLEGRRQGLVMSRDDSSPFHLEGDPAPEIHVLMRFSGGRINRIETFSANCPLDAGGLRFVRLDRVDASQSVRLLDEITSGSGPFELTDRDDRDEAMTAMAFHAEPSVTAALERHARTAADEDLREEAIFWLGQARERPGYEALVRLARELDDSEVREHITFALSQSPVPEAEQALIDMARSDRDPDVRGQALFWLGQEGGETAARTILAATREDPDEDVREEAVFALSQLPDGHGVERLLAIARDGSYPTDVRKEALFWLGQSEDPRALDLLAELLR